MVTQNAQTNAGTTKMDALKADVAAQTGAKPAHNTKRERAPKDAKPGEPKGKQADAKAPAVEVSKSEVATPEKKAASKPNKAAPEADKTPTNPVLAKWQEEADKILAKLAAKVKTGKEITAKDIAIGTRKIDGALITNPLVVMMKPGHNIRTMDSAETRDHIETDIKATMAVQGVIKPLTLAFDADTGRPFVKRGHCRYTGYVELLDSGVDVPGFMGSEQGLPFDWFTGSASEAEDFFDQITENNGEKISQLDAGRGFKRRVEKDGMSVQDIAANTGFSTTYVIKAIELAEAPEPVQEAVDSGQMSSTEALSVLSKVGPEQAPDVISEAAKVAAEMKGTTPDQVKVTGKHVDKAIERVGATVRERPTRGKNKAAGAATSSKPAATTNKPTENPNADNSKEVINGADLTPAAFRTMMRQFFDEPTVRPSLTGENHKDITVLNVPAGTWDRVLEYLGLAE